MLTWDEYCATITRLRLLYMRNPKPVEEPESPKQPAQEPESRQVDIRAA